VAKNASTRFEKATELTAESPTLIEGLPGMGMVASIAVDQVTQQLELSRHGTIVSPDFPAVAPFDSGRVRDPVRVYAGADPAVMTLQSDIPVPPTAFESLSRCVLDEVAEECDQALFLAGAPAESEASIGEVTGVATTEDIERTIADAEIGFPEGSGVIGGVTGSLLANCHREGVPAAALVVRSNPYIPDPEAARAVIETALEPLVEFDIDTQELREQAEEIQQQKRQIAEQLQQYQERDEQQPQTAGMYQ